MSPRHENEDAERLRGIIIMVIVAGALIAVPTVAFIVKGGSSVTIPLTPASFQPIRASARTFDVSSGANRAGLLASGITFSYSDPAHHYPGVSIFQSDPYRSDNDGNPIDTTKESISDLLETDGRLVIGDQVFYLHEYYFTEQIGVRTQFNFVDPGDTTSYVSPFADKIWTVNTVSDGFGAGYTTQNHHVDGVLCMYDQFDNGYFLNYEAAMPLAKISSCLTRVYFPSVQTAPPNDGKIYYTPEGAVAAVQNGNAGFGNAGIYIYPHITLQGLSDYIVYGNYTYNLTLPNGTRTIVQIKTNSAVVGFVDARKTGIDQQGDVPQAIPATVNEKTKADISNPVTTEKKAVETSTDPAGVTHTVLNGYIHPSPDTTDMAPSGGYNQVLGYATTLDNTQIHINLAAPGDNYGMAQELALTPSFFLQPRTTVVKATANMQWASDRRYTFAGVTVSPGDDTSWTGSASVYWPCGAKLVNQWAFTQFTVRVAIITTNQIGIVTSNGHQLNVTAILKDIGASSIIRDPTTDLTDVNLQTPASFDFLTWLGSLSLIWQIIIVVLIIGGLIIGVVIVLYIIARIKRAFKKE